MKRIVVILTIFMTISAFGILTHADASAVTDEAIQSLSETASEAAVLPCETVATPAATPSAQPLNAPLASDEAALPSQEEAAENTDPLEDSDTAESVDKTQEGDDPSSEADTQTLFAMLYEVVLRYATEILSALAALVSCLLALGYKKGLLPLLQQGMGVISGTVKHLGEKAESANQTVCEQSEATRLSTERIEHAVQAMSDSILALTERLSQLEQASAERAGIREALIGEIDMLSEIFLASSLPEYRKEKIGATVAKLKEQLRATQEA